MSDEQNTVSEEELNDANSAELSEDDLKDVAGGARPPSGVVIS